HLPAFGSSTRRIPDPAPQVSLLPPPRKVNWQYARPRLRIALLLLSAAAPTYRQALPGYRYQFPRDHFEHTDFRTEWWYYTGNVHARDGHRYGFELVFFRQGEHKGDAANPSA